MVQEGGIRTVCAVMEWSASPPEALMPPSLYTQTGRLLLRGEIIHHENAPLLKREEINPRGVIRLKSLKSSFLLFLEPLLLSCVLFSSN